MSLLSNLNKVLQKIIYSRILEYTTDANVISENQFGLKKEHSNVYQIARIKNKIMSNRRRKKSIRLMMVDNCCRQTCPGISAKFSTISRK